MSYDRPNLTNREVLKHPQKVRAAIAAGADVNARDGDGWTPLQIACCDADVPDASLHELLGHGGDVNATNRRQETLAHLAALSPARLERFIREGLDVNAQDDDFLTPLHNTEEAHIAVILLEAGADWTAREFEGLTPSEYDRKHRAGHVAKAIDGWVSARRRSAIIDQKLASREDSQGPSL